eukprot:TRINITY_DN3840_c0_g1_i1.p1 TRINITY_DN3840_c0_g1~~TRINITY_DN3840_c0_g1_i1.p1  ORF type:complete len:152 (-),score=17.34 TRINITY_DN3840_c0_g1_i1:625-1080(-)
MGVEATHKLVIPGNYDEIFDGPQAELARAALDGAKLLINEAFTVHEGPYVVKYVTESIVCHLHPRHPSGKSFAFQRDLSTLEQHASSIDLETNVLLSHSPRHGVLDYRNDSAYWDTHCGCPHLADRVKLMSKLGLHICGHMHEYGTCNFAV